MLHKETVSDTLFKTAQQLATIPELKLFRMVGGTAIALQLGHRKSIDIDLFSNDAVNKSLIANIIKSTFQSEIVVTEHSIQAEIRGIKIEWYDGWSTPFRHDALEQEGIRLASLHDLAAFKINAITGRREKKDYIDLFLLFQQLGPHNVLRDFSNYEPLLSPKSILFALTEVTTAYENKSVMPEMLVPVNWNDIHKAMIDAAQWYISFQK